VGIAYTLDAPEKFYTLNAFAYVNAKQHTKFLFIRLITFGNIEGDQNKNVGLLISPDTEDKFLYRTLVLVNTYEFAIFLLPNSITFGDTEEVP